MVAKIETGRSIRGILHYNEDKMAAGEAYLMMASGFAGEIDQMDFMQKLNRFRHLTCLNPRVKTNALHISLNFHVADKPDDEKLQRIAVEYMERIGFGDQPFLVYRHLDSAHPHIHIATVNIQRDGSRMDLHDIGKKRSEPARKAIELKYRLVRAEGREQQVREKLQRLEYGKQPTKRAIGNIVTRVSQEYAFGTFTEFKAILADFGVYADRGAEGTKMFEKKGLQYTAMDREGKPKGVPIKASSLYRRPTMANLGKSFERNMEKKLAFKPGLKAVLDGVLSRRLLSQDDFVSALAREQIVAVFRRSNRGQLYGITYIDHKNRAVFNGSELGKAYSAKAVSAKLEPKTVHLQEMKITEREKVLPVVRHSNVQPVVVDPLPLLDMLTKTDYEPAMVMPKRKKKRRKGKKNTPELTL